MRNRTFYQLVLLFIGITMPLLAQEPLYWVNGRPITAEEFHQIDPELIEQIATLPADEETIARYGPEAGNGVMVITLKNDTPARFEAEGYANFEAWLTEQANWGDSDPTARISLRFTISAEGTITHSEVLEATDKRLLRRIQKALMVSPRWQPALKMGVAVDSEQVITLTLPKGKQLPPERYVIIR